MQIARKPKETKIYFPSPSVQTIGKAKCIPVNHSMIITSGSNQETNCRLKSALVIENRSYVPSIINYALDQSPTSSQIKQYLEEKEKHGFGEGTIVARRFCRPHQWKYPSQWGMLMFVRKHASNHPFASYCVRWFSTKDSFEDVWAEDLIVIHTCLEESLLYDLVESQGVEVIRS